MKEKEEIIRMIQNIRDEWILRQIKRFIKNIAEKED